VTTDERATRQEGEWLVMHVLRRTWWHVDEGWERVPPERRRRWLQTLAVGMAAMLGLVLALVWVTRGLERAGALQWEAPFVEAFEARAPFSFGWAIWIESPGNGVVLWPLVLIAGGAAAWRRETLLAITIVGGFVLLDAAVLTGWKVWERARPDLVAGGIASSGESFSAFPSGHVSQTVVVYGLLVSLWLRRTDVRGEKVLGWSIVAFLTIAVAAGRLRLGAHWPTDIVAGALIGSFWLMVLLRSLRFSSTSPSGV
jgi:membrane-associated phospholipid phosphatase